MNADGIKRILGRDGRCINIGGLKASPFDVEMAARDHPALTGALISGLFTTKPAHPGHGRQLQMSAAVDTRAAGIEHVRGHA